MIDFIVTLTYILLIYVSPSIIPKVTLNILGHSSTLMQILIFLATVAVPNDRFHSPSYLLIIPSFFFLFSLMDDEAKGDVGRMKVVLG